MEYVHSSISRSYFPLLPASPVHNIPAVFCRKRIMFCPKMVIWASSSFQTLIPRVSLEPLSYLGNAPDNSVAVSLKNTKWGKINFLFRTAIILKTFLYHLYFMGVHTHSILYANASLTGAESVRSYTQECEKQTMVCDLRTSSE